MSTKIKIVFLVSNTIALYNRKDVNTQREIILENAIYLVGPQTELIFKMYIEYVY